VAVVVEEDIIITILTITGKDCDSRN
jgi:hypothetical protein